MITRILVNDYDEVSQEIYVDIHLDGRSEIAKNRNK